MKTGDFWKVISLGKKNWRKELTLNAVALNCGTALNVHSSGRLIHFQYSIAEKTAV